MRFPVQPEVADAMERLIAERDEARAALADLQDKDRHIIDAFGEMTERCYRAEAEVERLWKILHPNE